MGRRSDDADNRYDDAVGAQSNPDSFLALLGSRDAADRRQEAGATARGLYDELLRVTAEELAKTNVGGDGKSDANGGDKSTSASGNGCTDTGDNKRFNANGEGGLGADSDGSFGMSSEKSFDANQGNGNTGASRQNGPDTTGRFTRPQSVAFLIEHTGVNDPDGTACVAEALGDLPVALGQAVTTIRLVGYPRLDDYLANLREFGFDESADGPSSGGYDQPIPRPADGYSAFAPTALLMACQAVQDHLTEKDSASGDETAIHASTAFLQLAALALLAPPSVPRH